MKIYPNGEHLRHKKIVKWGVDATGNRLHLGHFVAIRFLRKMIKEHRDVVVVIGDKTALIGDPSGTIKERPRLEVSLVNENASKLEKQIRQLLPQARIIRNSEIGSQEWVLRSLSHVTVSELLDRQNFKGRGVRADELILPILQAMDSVSIFADIEVGGEDQEFNFSLTRKIQQLYGQNPEVCVMFPIIRGTDGNKMSKSLGNCIFLDDRNVSQKVLSIPDEVMDEWLPLFTEEKPYPQDPWERKQFLARVIIEQIN